MPSLEVNLGNKIPLKFQLFDGDNSLFVQATVKDDTGSPVTGSPKSLTNTGLGLYQDLSSGILMPSDDSVTATYTTFDDAGFVNVNSTHGQSEDTFNLKVPDQVILDLLEEIKVKVCDILAIVVAPQRILPLFALEAQLIPQRLSAILERVSLMSTLEAAELQAEVVLVKLQAEIILTDLQAQIEIVELTC